MDIQNTIAPQDELHEDHVDAEIREVNSDNSWILSANKKKYNHTDSFRKGYIDWVKKMPNVEKGNFVFIYLCKPQKQIRYLTRVEKIFEIGQMPQDAISEDKKYWKDGDGHYDDKAYMRLRLLAEMDVDELNIKILREKGFTPPQNYEGPTFFQKHPGLCEYLKEIFLSGTSNAIVHASQQQSFSNAHEILLNELEALLKNKKQVILTGAPGTGKTYLAKELAAKMIGVPPYALDIRDKGRSQKAIYDTVAFRDAREQYQFRQFHPGYDYSDFVEGLKPEVKDGKPCFERKDGVFMTFCKMAAKAIQDDMARAENVINNPKSSDNDIKEAHNLIEEACSKHPYVMVIDEINRADLSRVFGELFYGLEKDYRGEIISTQYDYLPGDSDSKDEIDFLIPPNVYIIGTMNDIDRSVESMDFALRRRFAWKEITIKDSEVILEKSIKDPKIRELIILLMKEVNTQIVKGMLKLGNENYLGASYFKDELDPDKLWKNQLSHILNEYRRSCRQKITLEDMENKYKEIYKGNNIKIYIEQYHNRYKWTHIYTKIADAILSYKDNRNKLLELTKKVANECKGNLDKIVNSQNETIDPFSVMAIFNFSSPSTRKSRIEELCKKLNITIDCNNYAFYGIPTAYSGLYDFWNFGNDQEDTCDTLWEYFERAISLADNMGNATRKEDFINSFEKVKSFKKKDGRSAQEFVTMLYRMRPNFYVPLDGNTQRYIWRHRTELDIERNDFSIAKLTGKQYLEICSKVRANLAKLGCNNIVDFSWKAFNAAEEAKAKKATEGKKSNDKNRKTK